MVNRSTLSATSTVAVEWSENYAPVTAHFTRFDSDLWYSIENDSLNQDYLGMYPPDPNDVIHVEDGSWSGADNGDPEFSEQGAWTAVDGREAVEKCRQDLPDVVLMDLRGFGPTNRGCLWELEQLLQEGWQVEAQGRLLRSASGVSGASVRTLIQRMRGPYSGVTSRQFLPIQPSPARWAPSLCEKLPQSFSREARNAARMGKTRCPFS